MQDHGGGRRISILKGKGIRRQGKKEKGKGQLKIKKEENEPS